MKRKIKTNDLFDLQIQNLIANSLVGKEHQIEVKYFSTLADIYRAISNKNVEHMALLSTESETIEQGFHSIKNILSEKHSVPMALFYKTENSEQLH